MFGPITISVQIPFPYKRGDAIGIPGLRKMDRLSRVLRWLHLADRRGPTRIGIITDILF